LEDGLDDHRFQRTEVGAKGVRVPFAGEDTPDGGDEVGPAALLQIVSEIQTFSV